MAVEAGDEEAVADVEAEWRTQLRRILRANPAEVAQLRAVLDSLAPEWETRQVTNVHNSINGGVQLGPVIQAGNVGPLTFG